MPYLVNGKQFIALAIGPNIICFGLPGENETKGFDWESRGLASVS